MFSSKTSLGVRRVLGRCRTVEALCGTGRPALFRPRHPLSTASAADKDADFEYVLSREGDIRQRSKERPQVREVVSFPSEKEQGQPVLLDAKEHVVGYLSRILNARVYEAAVETPLQYATNLSAVREWTG